MMGTQVPSRLRRLFAANLRVVRGRLGFAALCTLGATAAELLKPWPVKIILDQVILNKPLRPALRALDGLLAQSKVALLLESAAAIVAIALLGGVFSYFQVFITSSIGYKMVYALRRELFTHLQTLSLAFHNRARSGDLLTKLAADTNTLKNVFADAILRFVSYVLTVVGMLVIIASLDWRMALIALATLPFLGYSLFHLYRKTKRSVKAQRQQEGRVNARMSEVLQAVPLVQAFARERYEMRQFDTVTAETMRESIRVARLEAAATRSSEIITAFGTAGAVTFGALQVLGGRMLPGELVLVVSYLTNMYKPLRLLARLSTDFSRAMASAERISETLEIEPDITDRPDAIAAKGLKGEIVFQAVSFDYADGRDVLRDVSFNVSPGQRLALVGPSGAGKSTIVSLILRLYEAQRGTIFIDGRDVQQYRRASLRRQIGLVLQQSILFGATIRENIAYGKPKASLAEIEAAARAANADEFIRTLEHGYDTIVGERGATLSGGQRQRIAIARALIRDAPILILDEPMTGLDAESEGKVREALQRLMAGKTCIIVTHDLESVADADQVLVLDGGRVVDRGTHAELIARSGRYRELYEYGFEHPDAAGRSAVR